MNKKETLTKKLFDEYQMYNSVLPFHGWHHIVFVTKKAKEFALENKANIDIVEVAALTHDLNYLVKENSHPADGGNFRKNILEQAGYSQAEVEVVENIILEAHTADRTPNISLEAQALSDADTLFKALPITPVVYASQYAIENGVTIKEMAAKIVLEQNRLLDEIIYFYTDVAKQKYMKWAKTNLDLWNNIAESMGDQDVIELMDLTKDIWKYDWL